VGKDEENEMAEMGEDRAAGAAYERMPDIVLREIAGERFLIVLHAGESKMFELNGMGLWFWTQLERPATPSQLVERMLRDYDASAEAAAQEVDRFLAYLVSKGLARQQF
jgi:hypothetical protein